MAGSIRLDGVDLSPLSPTDRARLGIVHGPDNRGLFFGLTVTEHLRLAGLRTPDLRQAALAPFPALHDLRDRRVGLLSGGEQQMLSIARALGRGPRCCSSTSSASGWRQ
jgi:branched-chain amino acid transport system ATP-binding protein